MSVVECHRQGEIHEERRKKMKLFFDLRHAYYDLCPDYWEHFIKQGHEVVSLSTSRPMLEELGKERLYEMIANSDVMSVSNVSVTAEMMDLAPNLKLICMFGAGVDRIDIKAAGERGIPVVNSRCGATAVAELAVSMMMSLSRKLAYYDHDIRNGIWEVRMGCELTGKTVGIVGTGAIGREVIRMLNKGFNMKILAYDIVKDQKLIDEYGVEYVDLETVFAESDYVSMHMPLLPDTRGIANKKLFSLMKPTAFFINGSRGPLVVEEDLYEALQSGKIAGAGLDVFDPEPPVNNRFIKMRNVVMSPHSGANTPETAFRMAKDLTENIEDVLEGRMPRRNIVNKAYLKA